MRQRSRVLSSSGSDSDLSQVNNEEIIIPSGESDIEIEIENSLPDLKNKRNSNCTGTRRNAALTGEQQGKKHHEFMAVGRDRLGLGQLGVGTPNSGPD